jgi:hypothetical protein
LYIGDTYEEDVSTSTLANLVSTEDVRWSLYDGTNYQLVYYKDGNNQYHLKLAGNILENQGTFSSTRLLTVKDSAGSVMMVVSEAGDIELAGEEDEEGGEFFDERPYPRGL